jgi:integrase
MLNNKQIDSLKPTGRAYKVTDFDGLHLFISAIGTKTWRYNYKVNGKYQTKTYGRYPLLGIADARKLHHDFKYKLNTEAQSGLTFEQAARKWMVIHLPKLKNAKHKLQIANTLEEFIYPAVGQKLISNITRKELVQAVQAIDERGITETAHRVAGRVKQVFDYAVDLGELEVNPAIGLTRVLRQPKRKHMTALPFDELGKLIHDISTYDESITRIGLLLLALTFVRTRELTLAKWAEFDLKNKVWLIPEERLKLGKPHVVPLSSHAIKLIQELYSITGNLEYVLESPKRKGHPISENTLLFALYRLGYRGKMTGHGFRSIASSALNESGLWNLSAIERQLAHKETDAVRAAYHRAEYFDERVKMMEWWSSLVMNALVKS